MTEYQAVDGGRETKEPYLYNNYNKINSRLFSDGSECEIYPITFN